MSARKPRKRPYVPPPNEIKDEANRKVRHVKAKPSGGRSGNSKGGSYSPPKPTIKRTLVRLPIYFVLVAALQYVFMPDSKGVSDADKLTASLVMAVFVTIAFAPSIYLMERWNYTRWLRRAAGQANTKRGKE